MSPIVGIDEAGRGAVLGPLVVAAFFSPSFWSFPEGVKDSKLLTPKQREHLFSLLPVGFWEVEAISAREISERMRHQSLLEIELEAMLNLIQKAQQRWGKVKVFVDAPGRNVGKIKRWFLTRGLEDEDLIVETKADARYPVVSAASIVAKVLRDRAIAHLRARWPVGSGYPSDVLTRRAIVHFSDQLCDEIRWSWKTVSELLGPKVNGLNSPTEKLLID